MKRLPILFLCFFILWTSLDTKACSPILTPFQEWLNEYNPADFIIVEGYFQLEEDNYFTSTLHVTRSSDSLVRPGQTYNVFEYGPFGNQCEMYEMKASIDPELVGIDKPRVWIAYKDRCTANKLVTPIFWEAGVDVSNQEMVTKVYDSPSRTHQFYKCTLSLPEIWKQIMKPGPLRLAWEVME